MIPRPDQTNASVIVYETQYCGYCRMAKRLLQARNIEFAQFDVTGDRDMRSWLVKATGQRTVPQIFIRGESIGGFDELSALDRRGQLATRVAGDA
jgi:glutaredoxin 3